MLLIQPLLNGGFDFVDDFAAVAPGALHRIGQNPMPIRIQRREPQVLQLQTHGVETQAIGDGHIDVQGLAGNAAALVGTHETQRAHIVKPVGQLDEDHPDIPHHGQQHFAQILGLRLSPAFELDLGELGDAIHQLGDFLTENLRQLVFGHAGILDHIVENGGGNRFVIETHFRHDTGHRQWMGDIGIAGLAALLLVGIGAQQKRPVNLLHMIRRHVAFQFHPQPVEQRFQAGRRGALTNLDWNGRIQALAPV